MPSLQRGLGRQILALGCGGSRVDYPRAGRAGRPGGAASTSTTIGSRCPQWAISTPMGWLSCSVTACARKSSGDSAQPTADRFTGRGAGADPGCGADAGLDRCGAGRPRRRSPGSPGQVSRPARWPARDATQRGGSSAGSGPGRRERLVGDPVTSPVLGAGNRDRGPHAPGRDIHRMAPGSSVLGMSIAPSPFTSW